MGSRPSVRRALLGREVAIAFGIIVGLYFARFIRFQPLQIPAYLLIVSYDLVETALPVLTPYHPIGFPLFLYLLAIVGAGAAHRLRAGDGSEWRRAIGGVSLVVGSLSLLFGAVVGGPLVSPTDNPTPLSITVITGFILLVVGWWSLGQPGKPTSG